MSVPSNWRELQDSNAVTFSPDGGFGTLSGQDVFTHGIQIGLARNESHNLQTATEELIDGFMRGNPDMGQATRLERVTIDGRPGLRTTLSNVNEATRQRETIQLATTETRNGDLLYSIGVAPTNEFNAYRSVFNRVVGSIQLTR